MLIANPIYDVVFKYLFEDKSVAIKFLSLILDKKIIELDFRPTELKTKVSHKESLLTIYRIDFSAKIVNDDGSEELVIIEIQKAKYHTDIMRFRRYLGAQYSDKNNEYTVNSKKKALPIISIYFLGHKLERATAPVIKVARTYHDISQKDDNIINEKEEFIESLTHDSYIIQIPYLKKRRQTELLKVLSVFDQDNKDNNEHILNVKEEDLPKEYWPIIRRLQKAAANKEITDTMIAEDDVLTELQDIEREKEIAVADRNVAIAKEKAAIAKEKAAIAEKADIINKAVKLLVSQGMTEEEAMKNLGISEI